MDIKTHVTALRQQGSARMHPDAYTHWPRRKCRLDLAGRPQRCHRIGEDQKSSIAFAIDNVPIVGEATLLNDPPMSLEDLCPRCLTKIAHETRRSFYVRKEKRHRPRRQLHTIHTTRIADERPHTLCCPTRPKPKTWPAPAEARRYS